MRGFATPCVHLLADGFHCGRRFNAMAAERHIPKCTSIMAKPKTLARGGGATISRQMSGGQYVL